MSSRSEKTATGKSVLRAVALGPLHVYQKEVTGAAAAALGTPEEEWSSFLTASARAKQQLAGLYEHACASLGEEAAAIFAIHQLMLDDDTYLDRVRALIDQGASAAYAARTAGEKLSEMFAALEDEYMRARADDVRDVSQRVADILAGRERGALWEGEPVILAAEELSPSEAMQLDRSRLLGLVTRRGAVNSHTAILARAMGLPALVGADFDDDWDGHAAILDGENGILFVDPTPELCAAMQKRQSELAARRGFLDSLRGLPSVTRDGRRAAIYANVCGEADIAAATANDAEGIGLFRSEMLWMDAGCVPTEERQFEIYRDAVRAMAGRPVVIRTLDLGADKQSPFVRLEPEENPALGLRGIRVSLTRPELLNNQLRAILRASAFGPVSILLPMIISACEVRRARHCLEACRAALAAQNVPMGDTPLGVMIETPAAVMIADELAGEADFFSIGTNDLTQYTLAIDRQNQALDDFYDPRHPAVLRMVRLVVEAAHRRGRKVSICGELGADETLTETFLRMGVDALSVPPPAVLSLRGRVRALDLSAPDGSGHGA